MPRHWLSTAEICRFPRDEMLRIMERVCDNVDYAIDQVSGILPKGFPEQIAQSVFKGMKGARDRCGSSINFG